MDFIPAIICALLSLFGFKSLHLFAASNGLVERLESQISTKSTPSGKPLRTLITEGRIPVADLQINAVASFQLIFCENLLQPDVNIVGFWFAVSWCSSWVLIVLESLREYSRTRMMSWITIPGIFIYNQSHAVFTSLYLAIRLAVAAPAITREDLIVDTNHLHAIPWSFLLGNIFPLFIMAMPGLCVSRFDTKHLVASLYQQWNLYISLLHFLLVTWWSHTTTIPTPADGYAETFLSKLGSIYAFAFTMAVASVWIPIFISVGVRILQKIRKTPASHYKNLQLASLFIPPSPWSKVKCKDSFEGGKWLLQWDGIVGGLSTAIWAIALYSQARRIADSPEPLGSFCLKLAWYMILGGPMGIATGALWERDTLVFQQL